MLREVYTFAHDHTVGGTRIWTCLSDARLLSLLLVYHFLRNVEIVYLKQELSKNSPIGDRALNDIPRVQGPGLGFASS